MRLVPIDSFSFFVLLARFSLSLIVNFSDSDDEDDEEEADDDDLSSRLAGVSLDDADAVWQRLSSTERTEFEKLLQTGGITELLPEFSPWWEKYVKFLLLQSQYIIIKLHVLMYFWLNCFFRNSKLVEEVKLNDDSNSDVVKPERKPKCSIPHVVKDIPNFKDLCVSILEKTLVILFGQQTYPLFPFYFSPPEKNCFALSAVQHYKYNWFICVHSPML